MALLRRRGVISKNINREYDLLKDQAAKARQPYDRDMLLNLAFFLDQQYVEWASDWASLRTIRRDPKAQNAPRPVVNKIMHFVVQDAAYALANRPAVDVLPATDDPVDVSMTAPVLAYLRWLSEPQVGDFEEELADATMWALTSGPGYLKWIYNSRLGRPDFMSCSPFDIYPDPYAKKFHNARYVIHSQFMDVRQVFDQYGVEVKPAQVSKADQEKAAVLREMGQAPVVEGAIVNELWLKPGVSRENPEGQFVVWCGNEQLVPPDKFPYAHKQLPFSQIGAIRRPNSQFYASPVKYLRSPQMELNKYHAQRIKVRENFSNPKWWIPDELELEAQPDDSQNQVLRGSGATGQKPEIIQPTVFPEGQDGAWIRDEMQDVVGIHEVSNAQVPGRVEAAKAIELLRESDVSRLQELERTIKRSISLGFWQCLMLAKQYVPGETIVQTYSREGLPEVNRFKSENIKPGMRVQITMGTGLARSRAARQDQAMLMWDKGIIQDAEVMSELMEIPVGTIDPQRAYDVKLSRNENLTMSGGAAVKPNSWDAHDIHLREHNNYRKTAEFEALSEETKTKFEFHCQTHEQLQLRELMKDAQKQAILSGQAAGPEAGGGEPPAPPEEAPTGEAPSDTSPTQEEQQEPSAPPG